VIDALFVPDGDRFVPTGLCRGPWSAEAQHGGPPAALLARAADRFEDGERMQVTRLSVELLRPVPLTPLVVTTRWARAGKRVQLVEVSLATGDVEVARALALRIRRTELDLPPDALGRPAPPPGPEHGVPGHSAFRETEEPAFHRDGVEHRIVSGGLGVPGATTDWIRLRVPLVAGEPTSPLSRVAAAADFGNGISWIVSPAQGWQFINPDLTIHLHRLPAGEWVCLEAVTTVEPTGIGLAETRLWDERGPLGRSEQSLIVDRARS
jgi:hypothetical protein